jgi:hypothetical protein
MTKLRRAGHRLRFRYVKLVVVLVAMQACPATVCVSCPRDGHYMSVRHFCVAWGTAESFIKLKLDLPIILTLVLRVTVLALHRVYL